MKSVLLVSCILIVSMVHCQEPEKKKNTAFNQTDEETAEILRDFQKKPELLLCIGVFTKIPKHYLDKKISPMKEIISNQDVFGKYVDRYFFNSILSCVENAKKADKRKVAKDISTLFEQNTWLVNLERYFNFDDNVFLAKSFELTKEETEMKDLYVKITQAIQKYDYDSMSDQEKEFAVNHQLQKKDAEIDQYIKWNFIMYGSLGGAIFIIFYVAITMVYKMCTKRGKKSDDFMEVMADKKELRKNWKNLRKRRLENSEIERYLKSN